MGFWSDIAEQLGSDEVLKQLDRAQCEAIIDMLTLLVFADGEETFLEKTELEHLLHELPWALSNAAEVDAYRAESSARSKEAAAKGKEGLEAAAAQIASRLEGVDLRKKALKMAAQIAYADWDADHHEHLALHVVADAFEIPAPFAKAIVQDIGMEATEIISLDESTDAEAIPAPTMSSVSALLSGDFLGGFFSDLFDDDELRRLDHDGSMAFVDALTLALVADGYPEQEELVEFKNQLETLPFAPSEAGAVKVRVEETIQELRDASTEGTADFIARTGAAIPSDALKLAAIKMAATITHADFEITAQEESTLVKLSRGFGVDADELARILDGVRAESKDDLLG